MAPLSPLPDPRPAVVLDEDGTARVAGWRCESCAYPVAVPAPWCPRCQEELATARFGPGGTVWASTVLRVPLPGRVPPWGLVYVDLDDGPRVLGHFLDCDAPLPVGATVLLHEVTTDGDLLFRIDGV
jgi:uncharacterized OB-fold protein